MPAGKADADLKIKAGWGFMLKGMGGPFSGQTIPVTPLAVEMKNAQGGTLKGRDGCLKRAGETSQRLAMRMQRLDVALHRL